MNRYAADLQLIVASIRTASDRFVAVVTVITVQWVQLFLATISDRETSADVVLSTLWKHFAASTTT